MPTRPILLVEDNPDDVELTTLAFQEARITNPVVVARDGVEALDWLFGRGRHDGRDPHELPLVVLLDIGLPRLDGHGVLAELRAHPVTKTVPVVMLTSSDEEKDRLRSYALHANSYVRKPVDFEQFVDAARQLGLYWAVLNAAAPPGDLA